MITNWSFLNETLHNRRLLVNFDVEFLIIVNIYNYSAFWLQFINKFSLIVLNNRFKSTIVVSNKKGTLQNSISLLQYRNYQFLLFPLDFFFFVCFLFFFFVFRFPLFSECTQVLFALMHFRVDQFVCCVPTLSLFMASGRCDLRP